MDTTSSFSSFTLQESQSQTLSWRGVRWYAVFISLVGLVSMGLIYVLFNMSWHTYTQHQYVMIDLIATHNTDDYAELLPTLATDYLVVMRVDATVSALNTEGYSLPDNTTWQRWYRRTIFEAQQQLSNSFTSRDPAGDLWLHTGIRLTGGEILVLQQPFQPLFAPFYVAAVALVGLATLVIVSPLAAWWFLMRYFANPIRELTDISETIRWRGFLHEEDLDQINHIMTQKSPIGLLTQSIMAMEQQIKRRFFQLSTLLSTSRIVVSSLNVDEVLDNILEQVQTLFGCDRCAIVTLNQPMGTFRIRASRGLSPQYVQHLNIAPSEPNSPTMRALRNQTPIQVVDTETDLAYAEFRQRARTEAFRSVLAIPLATVHTPPAILLLYKDIPYHYSFSERELAISFGNHASLALENATLYLYSDQQRQIQTRRLEAIVESLSEALVLESDIGDIVYVNSQAKTVLGIEDQPNNLQAVIDTLLENVVAPKNAHYAYVEAYRSEGDCYLDITRLIGAQQTQDLRIRFFDVCDSHHKRLGRGQLWLDITHDKQLDRMKSALVATVSHELRTPLATIKGYISTLLANDVTWEAATQREFLETISHETNRLTRLISHILDLSQIESGLLKVDYQPTSLHELIYELLHSFSAEQRQHINVQLPADLPAVPMDASRIGTVIRNLVENAIKYAPESPIAVTAQHHDQSVVITVQDYGNGITDEEQDKIFERFYRSDNSLFRNASGVGLGLAICKGFVEAHHGQIWCANTALGASFSFSLPIHAPGEDHIA